MIITDLSKIEGRRYPARRRTQNLVGGVAPIQTKNFSMGNVTLDPKGGRPPDDDMADAVRWSQARRVSIAGDAGEQGRLRRLGSRADFCSESA